jgi:hypothetical protein
MPNPTTLSPIQLLFIAYGWVPHNQRLRLQVSRCAPPQDQIPRIISPPLLTTSLRGDLSEPMDSTSGHQTMIVVMLAPCVFAFILVVSHHVDSMSSCVLLASCPNRSLRVSPIYFPTQNRLGEASSFTHSSKRCCFPCRLPTLLDHLRPGIHPP